MTLVPFQSITKFSTGTGRDKMGRAGHSTSSTVPDWASCPVSTTFNASSIPTRSIRRARHWVEIPGVGDSAVPHAQFWPGW